MENDVQHLIDLLYDMIDNAKGVPLGNDKCIIERNRALDYLDEIRAQLPAELEEAKKAMEVLGLQFDRSETLQIEDAQHINLYFTKKKKTSLKYPRNYGQIKKKPLGG